MPLPLIIAGVAATAFGLKGHLSAKEKNEKAQKISDEAKSMYDRAKESLESEQRVAEQALLNLGNLKNKVLCSSIDRFIKAYERIKEVEVTDFNGLNELSKFSIDKQDILQLQEMSSIYSSSIATGTAGAATGAIIALAASGSLPIVTGTLSVAGSALAIGEIGSAASLAGSALSFGAAMTPLSAIAAPVVLFTGISASIKADENLEKAQAMYAEAEEACEKMKISQTLCKAITERSNMYNKLLSDLDVMYEACTILLDRVTKKKSKRAKGKTLTSADFTKQEMNLIAVSRALTTAVKTVINTPILNNNSSVTKESKEVYDDIMQELPKLSSSVEEVESYNYNTIKLPIQITNPKTDVNDANTDDDETTDVFRNSFAIFIGLLYLFTSDESYSKCFIFASAIILLIMNIKTKIKAFRRVRIVCCAILGISFGSLLWQYGYDYINSNLFVIKAVGGGICSFLAFGYFFMNLDSKTGSIKRLIIRLSGCALCLCIALLLLSFLQGFIKLPPDSVMSVVELLYVPCTIFCSFLPESKKLQMILRNQK